MPVFKRFNNHDQQERKKKKQFNKTILNGYNFNISNLNKNNSKKK